MNEPIEKPSPTAVRSGTKRAFGKKGDCPLEEGGLSPFFPNAIRPFALLVVGLFIAISLYVSRGQSLGPPPAGGDDDKPMTPTARAVAAANKFLDALDARQRERALYEFDSHKKSGWSNLPVSFVPRNGIGLGDLSREQRKGAMAVVASVLSQSGYQKVVDIMDGDQKLADGAGPAGKGKGGKGGRGMFGADKYYLAIFGKPSESRPWMVQFGGHHLGLNVTVIGKHFILTPTHTGAQPSLFRRDGKEVRPLGLENDAAFQLVNALSEKQRGQAILAARPQQELLLGPGRDGTKIEPQGVKASDLTPEQQAMLLDVIRAWVNIVEPEAAKARLEEIKGDLADTYFAWKGPTAKGSAVYFRVQGPSVVIEYAPQGSVDHIHTVVRNPKDDYGQASR